MLGNHFHVWIELALPRWLQFQIENIYLKKKKHTHTHTQAQHAHILLPEFALPKLLLLPKKSKLPTFFLGGGGAEAPPAPTTMTPPREWKRFNCGGKRPVPCSPRSRSIARCRIHAVTPLWSSSFRMCQRCWTTWLHLGRIRLTVLWNKNKRNTL